MATDNVDLPELSQEGGAARRRPAQRRRPGRERRRSIPLPIWKRCSTCRSRFSAVLGKSGMEVSQLLKLGRGTVVELDRKVGEAIDIYVNDRLVARGEVVLVEDRLGVTMTEIIKAGSGS